MVKLEYDILSALQTSHGLQYNELINKFADNINDTHDVLVVLYDDKLITASENIKEARRGFIQLSPKGVIALYAEKEHREFKETTEKTSRKQFKITQFIAAVAAIAVVIDVIVTILTL